MVKSISIGSYTVPHYFLPKEIGLLKSHSKGRYAMVSFLRGRHLFMKTGEKTCSCFGHSDVNITDDLIERTKIEIDKAVEDGVRIFLFGGRSDFDDLCYDLVTEKRNAEPQLNIKRVFCFALDNQLRKPPSWFIRKEYEALECPAKDYNYWYTSIYYRNLAMIDQSDLILFWVEKRENSGSYKTYLYAVKKHKKFINLFS